MLQQLQSSGCLCKENNEPNVHYDDSLLAGYNASFAMPDTLIALALDADTVLCY